MTRSALNSPSRFSASSSSVRKRRKSSRSFSIGHPDVLHARGAPEILATLALVRVEPVSLLADVHPRRLEVPDALALDHGAAFYRADVPHGPHGVVLGQHRRQLVTNAGD